MMSTVDEVLTAGDAFNVGKEVVEDINDFDLAKQSATQLSTDSDNSPKGKSLVNGTKCMNHNIESEEDANEDSVTEVPKLTSSQLRKKQQILKSLRACDVVDLKAAAVSEGGLLSDDIRQMVWPKLLGVDVHATSPRPTEEEVEKHPYYQQVLLDVNRSLKRFPPSIKEKQRLAMQDQLVLLIMRVLIKHPTFHYYQGYHDICVTFLLVLGEEMSFHVVERLSLTHLSVFMKKTMEPTVQMLNYMYPIFEKESVVLYNYLEKSDVGIMFALSWLITWFGHVLNHYSDVVRLFDLFMATSRWLPVYLSAAIVLYREKEILEVSCDMASIHGLLHNIPDDLPFEKLITHSLDLYCTYPPDSLTPTVLKQMEKNRKEMLSNKKQRPPKKSGLVRYVRGLITYILPHKKLTLSFVIAAAVLLSAIWYQSYKNN